MLVLIAESKTMRDGRKEFSAEALKEHTPAGTAQATEILKGLEALTGSELAEATGLTPTLVGRLRQMIYEFPNKNVGEEAIEAFSGVVFKALDYSSLSCEAKAMCNRDVRIISSLYGLLRPDDIIKPYRLDFTSKAGRGGKALNLFWKKDVTVGLARAIAEEGHGELLNLLPGDAAKCVDWKLVKRFCKVWKVDFMEIKEGGEKKTPSANKLKTLRGELLRHILSEGIERVSELSEIKSDSFIFEGTPVYPDHLQFLC